MPCQLSQAPSHPVNHPQHQRGCGKGSGAWHRDASRGQGHVDAGCPTRAVSRVQTSAAVWSGAGISPGCSWGHRGLKKNMARAL